MSDSSDRAVDKEKFAKLPRQWCPKLIISSPRRAALAVVYKKRQPLKNYHGGQPVAGAQRPSRSPSSDTSIHHLPGCHPVKTLFRPAAAFLSGSSPGRLPTLLVCGSSVRTCHISLSFRYNMAARPPKSEIPNLVRCPSTFP
jgi:hypothetical protein